MIDIYFILSKVQTSKVSKKFSKQSTNNKKVVIKKQAGKEKIEVL